MRKILLLLALMMAAAPAAAEEAVPRYDPAGWCARVADSGAGGSEMIRRSCLEMEQAAYDKLKPTWSGVPAKTRRWCDQVAKSDGRGSYTLLEQCIDMEFASKQKGDNSKFKF